MINALTLNPAIDLLPEKIPKMRVERL